jgi:23S rRNA (cytosine1962-C5)-methyltransferase
VFTRLTPEGFDDYALIDSGGFEKLERFGKYVLRRPEPQAVWSKSLSEQEWARMAHATFFRKKGQQGDGDAGNWELKPGMPDRWMIHYRKGSLKLQFRLGLTSFKHVGIFPEQAVNWDYLYDRLKGHSAERPRVLNLFAYTGGASLAACAAGADVTHVDSVKQVITWSRENMELSGLNNIRWVVEDAYRFVERELKRGKTYHAILLDPPAYGRGPDGEKWELEKQIDSLLAMCSRILLPEQSTLLLNLYSMGFSPMISETLVATHFGKGTSLSGELYLSDDAEKNLPLGTFLRLER